MQEVRRILLAGGDRGLRADGASSALYVMVMADGIAAKVGALERADNAVLRLQAVERKQRIRHPDEAAYPMRLAVVAELDGLDVSGPDADEAWSRTTHFETLMRFVLARRLGRMAAWPDWIWLDRTPKDDDWVSEMTTAWAEILRLGAGEGSTW